jgi:hypothetical protein
VGSIPANPDAQNVPSFRRWRYEMKLPFHTVVLDDEVMVKQMGVARTTEFPNLILIEVSELNGIVRIIDISDCKQFCSLIH